MLVQGKQELHEACRRPPSQLANPQHRKSRHAQRDPQLVDSQMFWNRNVADRISLPIYLRLLSSWFVAYCPFFPLLILYIFVISCFVCYCCCHCCCCFFVLFCYYYFICLLINLLLIGVGWVGSSFRLLIRFESMLVCLHSCLKNSICSLNISE